MAEFVKLRATQASLVLESVDSERQVLVSSIGSLFQSLIFVFVLLTIVRIGVLASDFGMVQILEFRLLLMTAWTALLFLASFALSVAVSFVLTLAFSSAMGRSIPPSLTVAIFCGLASFVLVSLWQSWLPWYFGGYLSNELALNGVAGVSMAIATLWPKQNCVIRKASSALHVKHLLGTTAIVAGLLVAVESMCSGNDAMLVFRQAARYIVMQALIVLAFWRWVKMR